MTALHARVVHLFDQLLLGEATSWTDVAQRISDARQLSIRVHAVGNRRWRTVTGVTAVCEDTAHIFIRKSDARWYQLHTVLHELGHLAFGHDGCELDPQQPGTGRLLARGMRGAELAMQIDFSNPASVAEGEAEHFAHLLSAALLGDEGSLAEEIFG